MDSLFFPILGIFYWTNSVEFCNISKDNERMVYYVKMKKGQF